MSYGLFASLFETGRSFCLIDTRERRDHVDGHWFGSTNIPLSVLTTRIQILVPDRHFPVYLLDWQDAASEAAANRLLALGYADVILCPTERPREFGNGFVKGEYVWSKAFGEVVAHRCGLPEVTPATYLERAADSLLLDVRPTAEYREFTLPASQSLPNSLLLANMDALKETGRTALLHCAGRTRSIIGACTLKAAGYDGSFAIFRGGTQAWQLDGHEREFAADRVFASKTASDVATRTFLGKWKIPVEDVEAGDIERFVSTHRNDHLFDLSDDAAKCHPLDHGITGVSGTNLIQQTDQSIARWHVPVILFDTGSGSRAAFAAYWLKSMGFEVKVVILKAGPGKARSPVPENHRTESEPESVTLAQLIAHRDLSGRILDFRPSKAFRKERLTGSEWHNIGEILSGDPLAERPAGPIMIIATDWGHGCETADLLARQGWRISGVFAWETAAPAGANIKPGNLQCTIDESALFARRHHGNMQEARDYLAWEEELPNQIDPVILDLWNRLLAP